MRMRIATVAAAFAWLAFAQEGEAPPAIAQGGVVNFASHMPPQLASGGLAPGSLIRIRGWRLGPAPLDHVIVRIRHGDTAFDATAIADSENEVEAQVPIKTQPGSAVLQVIKNGQASLESPVTIVDASFGAFSRNGQGWGPGEVSNSKGVANSEEHPAKPGDLVTLAGTGLGIAAAARRFQTQVLVGGHAASDVHLLAPVAARPGVDSIAFTLPAGAPEGCHVPIEVVSRPGIYSNAVTMAISHNGQPCHDLAAGIARTDTGAVRLATVTLVHADLELALTPNDHSTNPVDAAIASFATIPPDSPVNPLFLFPPVGTCTSYTGIAGLRSLTSPLALLEALPGKPLDAGPRVTVRGPNGEQSLPARGESAGTYWRVIGGRPPVPGMSDLPLFLTPGEYRVSAAGGAAVASFETNMRVADPIQWTNREQFMEIDRTRGATISWQSAVIQGFVLIVAMNEDSRSGAMGIAACVADPAAGNFAIPGYALANIPPTPAHPRGFPLNLTMLLELPNLSMTPANAPGLDRVLAFAASASVRTVRFK